MRLFAAMSSQWLRTGGVATALNLVALPIVEARIGLPRRMRRRCFVDLQLMQAEILRAWAERREREERSRR